MGGIVADVPRYAIACVDIVTALRSASPSADRSTEGGDARIGRPLLTVVVSSAGRTAGCDLSDPDRLIPDHRCDRDQTERDRKEVDH